MSNLSNELFFEAHRGLIGKPDPQYGIGMHFSKSERTARRFASRAYWQPGTVIHAEVPLSSVETDPKVLGQRGYAGFGGKDPLAEEEIPVRQGAPIRITGRTSLSPAVPNSNNERRIRKRTYNPPREMQA